MSKGLVVTIGDDEEIKLEVNDKVLFAKYSGTEFKIDGTEYLLFEANDVLANSSITNDNLLPKVIGTKIRSLLTSDF